MARGLDRDQQRDPVLRAIHRQLRPVTRAGERVLAAVSGGVDSLALAVGLAEIAPRLGLDVCVATVDHGLRPGSGYEVERVRRWSEARGLPFASEQVAVAREGGLEAAARRARYAALERLADRLGAAWIATAHTASDQAETVLLRLGRGAALRGARGVLPLRGRIVRPLLEITRPELERFLAARGLAPLVVDPSNEDLSRARNRIRHRVMPELRAALGPGVDRALARFAQLARADEEALQARVPRLGPAHLRRAHPALVRRWLRQRCEALGYAPNARELQRAAEAVREGRPRELELGRRIRIRVGEQVEVTPSGPAPVGDAVEVRPGAEVRVPWAGLAFHLVPRASGPLGADALALPPDVRLPLVVRPPRPGDALAGERGTVRLNRLLIDRKVPRPSRARFPLVLDAEGAVLWAVGLRVSARLAGAPARLDGWTLRIRPLVASRADDSAGG